MQVTLSILPRTPPPRIGCLLILGPLLSLSLLGCAGKVSAPVAKNACCQEIKTSASVTNRSVYQLSCDWTTDAGKTIKLGQLRGKPQVAAMFFSSCQKACPILLHEMQQVAESLPENLRTNVGFLLVSFDPEHDSPEVLRAYRVARNLPDSQWTLLHGEPEDVAALAGLLGVNYRQRGSSQFAHSSVLTILDSKGEISYQQFGLNLYPDRFRTRLMSLLQP